MKWGHWSYSTSFFLVAAGALVIDGCGEANTKGDQTRQKGAKDKPAQVALASKEEKKSDPSGWWCDEHGVPEEICGQCDAKLAAEFKKKRDWCKEHDRPESQCFICHPELKEKFAAQYRAKYGKEPPLTEEESKKSEGAKEKPKK
jgi:hypothetical protein